MSVQIENDVFMILSRGTKTKVGTAKLTLSDYMPIGGRLYHVVDGDNGASYEFIDRHGQPVNPISLVGGVEKLNADGANVFAYKKTGTSTFDKFYVYNDDLILSKTWTYKANDAWVYNLLSTGVNVGQGKSNTEIVMAADSGAYPAYANTIWNALATARTNLVGGYNDWFVPSKAEVEALRTAIGYQVLTRASASDPFPDPVILPAGVVTGGTIAGVADGQAHYKDYNNTRTCYPSNTKFINTYIWSSSEFSAQYSWYWAYSYQYWDNANKYASLSVLFARAF